MLSTYREGSAWSVAAWNEPPSELKEGAIVNLFDEAVIIINSIKSLPLGIGILKQTDTIRILHAAIK